MQKLLLAGSFLFLCLFAEAQTPVIRGIIRDTTEKKNIRYAVVALLKRSDSTLVRFTRSAENGHFELRPAEEGHYVIRVSSPGFANYSDTLILGSQLPLELGTIALTPSATLMKEVVVRSGSSIRLKGDTTEFTADSFHVREGATVEELLKKLPGLTVNSKGEITAQGKKVDKVLVDGEEFFGDDPTLATQNIGAKAVDKVQVFDTKTETQQITGQTTGSEGKTINIKLKEDAKKGAFGKFDLSSNFDKLHNGTAMYNRFKGKLKNSVYLIKSNTSAGNLNWEDRQKMGVENDMQYDEIGGYYFSFGTDDGFSDWNLHGLPSAWSGGALFSNKWKQDKNAFNGSYKFNRLANQNTTTTLTQTLLADTTFFNNSSSVSDGWKQQHNLNGKYEWKPDSLTTLKLTSTGTLRTGHTRTDYTTEALNEERLPVNQGTRNVESDMDHKGLENVFSLKRLSAKKKDRTLLATFRLGINDDNNSSSLRSSTQFYKNNLPDSVGVTDQYKDNRGHAVTYGTKITYSEPLNTKWTWINDAGYNASHSTSGKNTFEKDNLGKYTVLNPDYSNHFDLKVNGASANSVFRYVTKKIRAFAGAGFSTLHLNLLNTDNNKRTEYSFFNFIPQASINYNLKQQSNISVRYQGSTVQPKIDQLQPVRSNDDPLNVSVGNPNLRAGYNHQISFFMNSFKMLTQRALWINWGGNFIQHDVTTTSSVDAYGVRTYMPVNVNGNYNWYMYAYYDLRNTPKKLNHSLNVQGNGARNLNFVNGLQNITHYSDIGFSYAVRYTIEEKFNISLEPGIHRNLSSGTLRKDVNNNYWSWGGQANLYYKLPGKIDLNTDADFQYRERTAVFRNTPNVIRWNASLERKFGKKKNSILYFKTNDLLRQYKGIERTAQDSFISEQRYQQVGRYFMLGFRWTFNQMPGGEANGK